jgi:hypothetical protein
MRAGPLSNAKVVGLINRYFVPVYVSNEDYAKNGPAPAEEKAEKQRVYREALQAKLSTGTVHVYVLTPDGHPVDSLHVATASKVEELTAMLERAVAKLKAPAGGPLVKPAPQSRPAGAAADALVLHVTARYLHRKGNELVPLGAEARRGESRNAGWHANPGEDWVVLPRPEWAKLLPAGKAEPGRSWAPDAEVVAELLTHFYPPTENNNVARNRIEEQSLRAKVLSVEGGVARARLDGRLKMKHRFYHRDDDNRVEAALLGYLEYEPRTGAIRGFQLVTDGATYGPQKSPFGVAVRAVPE